MNIFLCLLNLAFGVAGISGEPTTGNLWAAALNFFVAGFSLALWIATHINNWVR